jgi:hypothetical protein
MRDENEGLVLRGRKTVPWPVCLGCEDGGISRERLGNELVAREAETRRGMDGGISREGRDLGVSVVRGRRKKRYPWSIFWGSEGVGMPREVRG